MTIIKLLIMEYGSRVTLGNRCIEAEIMEVEAEEEKERIEFTVWQHPDRPRLLMIKYQGDSEAEACRVLAGEP